MADEQLSYNTDQRTMGTEGYSAEDAAERRYQEAIRTIPFQELSSEYQARLMQEAGDALIAETGQAVRPMDNASLNEGEPEMRTLRRMNFPEMPARSELPKKMDMSGFGAGPERNNIRKAGMGAGLKTRMAPPVSDEVEGAPEPLYDRE
tara:strand:+ start:991 stop:1437 length:447 start_codon:yes stop_codon:yes gene_type:complete